MSIHTNRLCVWQVIQSFAQINEEKARELCQEFLEATELLSEISINDYADKTVQHTEFVENMYTICNNSSYYDLDLTLNPRVTGADPFFYSRKVSQEDLISYVTPAIGDYFCTICGDNYESGGVRLSCDNRNNCCTFCRECIEPWITQQVAKCPNCTEYLRPVCA
jgi:hypothetical protein